MVSQNDFFVTKNYSFKKDIYDIYQSYSKYVSKLSIANDTRDWRLKHIRGFLLFVSKNNIKIKNIKPLNIYNYMMEIENKSLKTKEHRAVCIRLFIDYLYNEKIISYNGKSVFPIIKCYKESSMISTYNDEEITKVINAVDVKKKNGKRDLAIILLFARLGLRPRDVMNLKMDEISWKDNSVKIIQSKNNWINILPINNEIRYALLDYIKNERPSSKSVYVFLKDSDSIYGHHLFYNVVDKYFKKANINIKNKRHGPYALRHSIGTSLLKDNNSINNISNILGHQSTENSRAYLKVDINSLKKISLGVPKWKN